MKLLGLILTKCALVILGISSVGLVSHDFATHRLSSKSGAAQAIKPAVILTKELIHDTVDRPVDNYRFANAKANIIDQNDTFQIAYHYGKFSILKISISDSTYSNGLSKLNVSRQSVIVPQVNTNPKVHLKNKQIESMLDIHHDKETIKVKQDQE